MKYPPETKRPQPSSTVIENNGYGKDNILTIMGLIFLGSLIFAIGFVLGVFISSR